MPLNLPPEVIDALRDRYLAAVADAQLGFVSARADEDAVTGALGQELARRPAIVVHVGQVDYLLKVHWQKLRGRGHNAPERLYGPDGIFQLELFDERGKVIARKGLPFQAKTEWKGKNSRLAAQSGDIEASLGSGVVVNFTATGYEACTTKAAFMSGGQYDLAKLSGELRPLGHVLANDFLDCKVGTLGLFFDPISERFVGESGVPIEPRHAITTRVERRTRKLRN